MEELLGEDLKGKMINALDEVTNDPTLTRVFTHGMMSTMAESFGLPADLHSRFALSSFFGTNSYDGMSAKSFMGPSVAILTSNLTEKELETFNNLQKTPLTGTERSRRYHLQRKLRPILEKILS